MNCGFSNLDFLKKQLLAKSFGTDTRFDDLIQSIGLGVAGAFARLCNRDWAYQASIKEVAQGDRSQWYVRHSPVTQFTDVELRYFHSDSWVSIFNQPLAADEEKGLIHFGYTLGRAPLQFRVTYNGGYIWEMLEPDDPGYPSMIPSDITNNQAGLDPAKFNLPDELRLAWLLQCKHVWKFQDKVGTDILKDGKTESLRFPDDLAVTVESTLAAYKRYQLT